MDDNKHCVKVFIIIIYFACSKFKMQIAATKKTTAHLSV